MHIYQPNYSWKLLLDYKKKTPARPERADFNSSFIRFVRCCKTSRRWKKKSLCCSFQASQQKKIFLAILNGWTLQRDQVCVKKCVTRNEKWNSNGAIQKLLVNIWEICKLLSTFREKNYQHKCHEESKLLNSQLMFRKSSFIFEVQKRFRLNQEQIFTTEFHLFFVSVI